ncbi:MAG: hypothetical protein FWD69_17265 [Polyangiaceae bacterium]|nr:hypothetical protein [Polyangiaceae bacterium]
MNIRHDARSFGTTGSPVPRAGGRVARPTSTRPGGARAEREASRAEGATTDKGQGVELVTQVAEIVRESAGIAV